MSAGEKVSRIGYGFQAFVAPEYRRKGVVGRLDQQAENFATQQDAIFIYGLIIEGNVPALRWHEHSGYKLHKTLVVPGIAVYKEMDVRSKWTVRQARPEEQPVFSDLCLNLSSPVIY